MAEPEEPEGPPKPDIEVGQATVDPPDPYGYDTDDEADDIIEQEVVVYKCSEPGCNLTLSQADNVFRDENSWIRNRKSDNTLEYWCPEHGEGKCLHGLHGQGMDGFQRELKVSQDDGRPSVVCIQCQQVWVCAPADLFMGDRLPKDVLVDMIHEGRWDEALTVFYELCMFSAQPTIPARLVEMANQMLGIPNNKNMHQTGHAYGERLAREVIRIAEQRPQDPEILAFEKQNGTPQSLPDNPTDVKDIP